MTSVRRILPWCGSSGRRGATRGRDSGALTLDDLTAKSTAIVRGKVISSYASFRGPIIYTHYQVQVSEQQGTSGSSLDVVIPSGTANNLRQIYSGAPQLNLGGEFGLFLWTGPSGLTQIMGLTQGLFRLSPGDRSSRVVTRAASTELMLEAGTAVG